jgi:hypothetical protein
MDGSGGLAGVGGIAAIDTSVRSPLGVVLTKRSVGP